MIEKLAAKLRAGETTSVALTESYLRQIREKNDSLGAFITVCEADAMKQAEAADRRLAQGDAPLLCGIPMALKDNILSAGICTTCASRMLASFVPPCSAHVWEKLSASGAVLLGKTNMDEFAMGASGETSAIGPCLHPHDRSRVAGGSSGGSAAAVAAGMACYTLGSDTGGSVRVPAAYCGVVGVKPTYGRISRRGLVAFASSLDQIGVCAASVRDSMTVLSAIVGADAGDMTCARRACDFADAEPSLRGTRIGVPAVLTGEADASVLDALARAVRLCEAGGATAVPVTLPAWEDCYAAYYLISSAEASSNLARYDGIRYGGDAPSPEEARSVFGAEVKRRILCGTAALSVENRGEAYERACRMRTHIRAQMREIFTQCDAVLTPTVPTVAPRLGAHDGEALAHREADRFTTLASLAGIPALSLPAGTADGLPLGVQLMTDAWKERTLFALSLALEEVMRRDA